MRKELVKKRLAAEAGSMEAWLTRGKGGFHFENIRILRPIVSAVLTLAGLRRRAERNAGAPGLRRITLPVRGLPPAFEGYTLLHLSDLHLDGVAGLTAALCAMLDGVTADACVMTGDYRFEIDGPCGPAGWETAEVLRHVTAPDGVFAVLGNHDFLEEAELLERAGVVMLLNRAVPLTRGGDRLWVAGVDDPHYYGTDDLPAALEEVPEGEPVVLLVHSPELFREAAERGVGLYLCGHTHGGQISLPLLGPPLVNANCPRRMAAGVWREGAMVGHTSPGAGASMLPVRLCCPGEVTLISLTGEAPQETGRHTP
jgi:predicted MPP superfamily phosphohydrolase